MTKYLNFIGDDGQRKPRLRVIAGDENARTIRNLRTVLRNEEFESELLAERDLPCFSDSIYVSERHKHSRNRF